ncbi:family 16 glycosylhydrolase [Roseobacter sp. N2S]|uniref:family 16 glycosylhydrolase n=1 Tax=Roseobacter sp. N2S TaxID=2663844 RepID=UPI002865A7C4|nr:family 16 glycosylhydrolase [Roseobacter sp. N2S]MDR6263029.1 hypothetical protein [Roseobacter sp. N2S]
MANVPKGVVFCIFVFSGWAMATHAEELTKGFVESFSSVSLTDWHVAEYDFGHPHFDTDWRKAQAVFGDTLASSTQNGLLLKLSPAVELSATHNRFIGGSIRRLIPTGFGRYESWIQPSLNPGTIAGFFTYSGPAYGTQHDEIDIEFLGKNMNQLHIAWFVNGALTNKFIDLGFNTSEKPHHYAFDWLPEKIRWYVDGRSVFETSKADGPLPAPPGLLFANIWAADPSIQKWAGLANPKSSGEAYFNQISFTPLTKMRDEVTTIGTMESERHLFLE